MVFFHSWLTLGVAHVVMFGASVYVSCLDSDGHLLIIEHRDPLADVYGSCELPAFGSDCDSVLGASTHDGPFWRSMQARDSRGSSNVFSTSVGHGKIELF